MSERGKLQDGGNAAIVIRFVILISGKAALSFPMR
jgi:hypothetical protein